MKNLLQTLTIVIFTSFHALGQTDYIIQLNDQTFEIAANKQYTFEVDGEEIDLSLRLKDILIYDDDFYSFSYPKDFKVSKMVVDEGIEQIMLMTAEGSGIIIQKYATIDPTMLKELMLSEVTKESISYGFQLTRNDYNRKLKSGEDLDVLKAVLKYRDETNIYEVASIAQKDEGLIIVTMTMDENYSEQGLKMIDLMWDSLVKR